MDDILAVHRIAVQNSLSNTKEENWQNGFRMWSMIANELKKMNLYEVYEQSFINELIYFLFWALLIWMCLLCKRLRKVLRLSAIVTIIYRMRWRRSSECYLMGKIFSFREICGRGIKR